MGCGPSSLEAAHLSNLLADPLGDNGDANEDDGKRLVERLRASPWLLSTAASVLCSSHGTPLHAACEGKRIKAVEAMLSFLASSPLPVVREALRPLCRRTHCAPPASVEQGLSMALDMTNSKGQTPLMLACASGSPQLVRLLLAQGADPWVGDHCGGRAALHYAAMAGHADCIEALMNGLRPHKASRDGLSYINVRTQCGLSALHYAVFHGHNAAVEELLGHDPNLNAASTGGDCPDLPPPCSVAQSTPLHLGAVKANVQVIKQLLQHYALCPQVREARTQDLRLCRNEEGQLPWQVAALHHPSHRELIALIHPGQSLQRTLGLDPGLGVPLGPDGGPAPLASNLVRGAPLLASLAAAALSAKLLGDLRAIRERELRKALVLPHVGAVAVVTTTTPSSGKAAGAPAGGHGDGTTRRASASEAVVGSPKQRPPRGAAASPAGRRRSRASSLGGSRIGGIGGGGGGLGGLAGLYDDDDEEGLCGVCLERMEEVASTGCRHAVCGQCAEEMVRGITATGRMGGLRPLLCPFCRQEVSGFTEVVVVAPAVPPVAAAKPPLSPAAATAAAAARAALSRSSDKQGLMAKAVAAVASHLRDDTARAAVPRTPGGAVPGTPGTAVGGGSTVSRPRTPSVPQGRPPTAPTITTSTASTPRASATALMPTATVTADVVRQDASDQQPPARQHPPRPPLPRLIIEHDPASAPAAIATAGNAAAPAGQEEAVGPRVSANVGSVPVDTSGRTESHEQVPPVSTAAAPAPALAPSAPACRALRDAPGGRPPVSPRGGRWPAGLPGSVGASVSGSLRQSLSPSHGRVSPRQSLNPARSPRQSLAPARSGGSVRQSLAPARASGSLRQSVSPARASVSPSRRSVSPSTRVRRKTVALRHLRDRRKRAAGPPVTAAAPPGTPPRAPVPAVAAPQDLSLKAAAGAAARAGARKDAAPGGRGTGGPEPTRMVTCIGFAGGGRRVVPVVSSGPAPPQSPSRPLSAPSPRLGPPRPPAAAAAAVDTEPDAESQPDAGDGVRESAGRMYGHRHHHYQHHHHNQPEAPPVAGSKEAPAPVAVPATGLGSGAGWPPRVTLHRAAARPPRDTEVAAAQSRQRV